MRKNMFSWIAIISIMIMMSMAVYIITTHTTPAFCLYVAATCLIIIPCYEIYVLIHNAQFPGDLYELPLIKFSRHSTIRRWVRSIMMLIFGIVGIIAIIRYM